MQYIDCRNTANVDGYASLTESYIKRHSEILAIADSSVDHDDLIYKNKKESAERNCLTSQVKGCGEDLQFKLTIVDAFRIRMKM